MTNVTYGVNGMETVTYANGVTTTFSYAPERGWQTRIRTVKGATVVQDITYARDAAGRRTRIVSSPSSGGTDESWEFAYDDWSQLTRATPLTPTAQSSQTYMYDPIGNLTKMNGVAMSYPASGPTAFGRTR